MSEASLIIILLFTLYFVLHSLLASLWVKQHVATCCPGLVPYYRLLFNGVALLLVLPLLYVIWRYPGETLWQWQGLGFYLTSALALGAVGLFIYSLSLYDMHEFLGLRQIAEHSAQVRDQEHLKISPLHRFVRHPWYFIILVLIWTRDLTTTQLLTYSLVTLYLVVGSRLEERKLIAYHGEVYAHYRKRVPGLIPLPWKFLRKDEARALMGEYAHSKPQTTESEHDQNPSD